MNLENDMENVLVLSPKEYADRFGLHPDTVYKAIRAGRLRHRVERVLNRTIRILVPRVTRVEEHHETS